MTQEPDGMRGRSVRCVAGAAGVGLLVWALAVGGWGLGAAEGGEAEPPRIERIEIRGVSLVDRGTIEARIRVRVGDAYRREAAEADIKRILDLGLFTDVKVDETRTPTGVALTYTVFEKRRAGRVIFRGNARFSDRELLEVTGLGKATFVDDFRLASATQAIERRYRESGYAEVKAEGRYEMLEGEPVVVISLREGARVRVRSIAFQGVKAFRERVLRNLMKTETYFFILRSGTFNQEAVEEDVRRLREYYLQQGYLDAEVSSNVVYNLPRTRVTVEILLREGTPFTVGAVTVRGARVFSAEEVTRQVSLKAGGRYTGLALAADQRAIRRLYGGEGYLTTAVKAEPRFTDKPTVVDVLFEIEEGPQVRLAGIQVEGNEKTRSDVILRELRVEPGQVLDGGKLEESRRRLERLRYFSTVKLDRLEGADPAQKDLIVEVEEGDTATIWLGASFSSDSGVMGTISFTQRNFDIGRWPRSFEDLAEGRAFVGGGQSFSIQLEPGTELQRYQVEFREPYLFGSDYSFGARLFLTERTRGEYDEGRVGTRLSVGRRFGEKVSAQVALRLEQIEITNIDADAPPDVFAVEGQSLLTSVELTVAHDTRDDWLDPVTGHRYTATVEQAGAAGGDYAFTRLEGRAGWYWPVAFADNRAAAHVLSAWVRAGVIFNDAPIFERFYAGGTRMMRGFAFRGMGPHVGDYSVGGEFMLVGSLEYSFPIVEEVLRGVLFFDAGTVEKDVEVTTIRASVGFGLRLYIGALGPVPMQFNFGFPLAKDEQDETEVFTFTIGAQL